MKDMLFLWRLIAYQCSISCTVVKLKEDLRVNIQRQHDAKTGYLFKTISPSSPILLLHRPLLYQNESTAMSTPYHTNFVISHKIVRTYMLGFQDRLARPWETFSSQSGGVESQLLQTTA
jgi:hypothetical protein